MLEIDKLKSLMLNANQLSLFNLLPKPVIPLVEPQSEKTARVVPIDEGLNENMRNLNDLFNDGNDDESDQIEKSLKAFAAYKEMSRLKENPLD